MADNVELVRGLGGVEDLYLAASGTMSVAILDETGAEVAYTVTAINAGNIPVDAASVGTFGAVSIGAALRSLSSGSGIAFASTTVAGLAYRTSYAPSVPNEPVMVITDDPAYGRIPSVAEKAALDAGLTPGSSDAFLTRNGADSDPAYLGTGKDGTYAVGSITDPALAPSGLASTPLAGAVPAGTYTYKVVFRNMSGSTLPSSASSTITIGAAATISGTLPVGGSNTQARELYRDDGSSSWHLVQVIGNNTDTTFTDSLPIKSATTAPGSNTTGSSWGTPSGEWHFTGDMTLGAITLASSGSSAGTLIIRCRGNVTIGGAISGDGKSTSPGIGAAPTLGAVSSSDVDVSPGGVGTGINWLMTNMGGVGAPGVAGAGAAGGAAGAHIRIYAYSITMSANISASGSAGANGANGGGGGGSGGTIALVARDYISTGTVTASANGAAGGNGTSNSAGGGGGGGGLILLLAPIISDANLTTSVTAGAAGTSNGTASTWLSGGGGGCAGAGGYGSNNTTTPGGGVAGQVIIGGTTAVGYRFPVHAL